MIPTLHAGADLRDTLDSLAAQTFRDFDVIVVDNSGERLAAKHATGRALDLMVLYMETNVGFGAAINRALTETSSPLVAILNDDAPPHEEWLSALVSAATTFPEFGMFSCQIRLANSDSLDSTGMELSRDGSSIQRGHGNAWREESHPAACLLPSGCAALYRRKALDEATETGAPGPFDETFQLYCEDTDLGLRLLWQSWRCRYVHDAVVEHRYSRSAGPISPLKAYLVERNRLFVVMKNFPFSDTIAALAFAPLRYLYHLFAIFGGQGKSGAFARSSHGWKLPWFVVKAHFAALFALPRLLRQRHEIRKGARLSKDKFREAIYIHRVSLRKVAQH